MRQEKAYDYFSAYFEGSLDLSLKAQFERVLESNPAMQEEYAAFAASLLSLNELAHVEVDVPADLHERITSRLDRHVFESERKRPRSFLSHWRQLVIGGVASVAIIGGVMTVSQRQNTGKFGASPVPISSSETGLKIEAGDEGTFLKYRPNANDEVEVRRIKDGVIQKIYPVSSSDPLYVPLKFGGRDPLAVRISRKSDQESIVVILPGSVRTGDLVGSGTVQKFAESIAGLSGRAVLLDSSRDAEEIRWKINPADVTSPQDYPGLTLEVKGRLIRIRY